MGLDATVRCRCWEEKRFRTPPPFAEHVRVDEEACLNLDLPWEGNQDKHLRFARWRETCCTHDRMNYACEAIASWTGYRVFQAKLAEFGWQHFPTLHAVLPKGNGGLTSPQNSATALIELDDFARRDFGQQTVL